MTHLEQLLIQQLKELTDQFNQQFDVLTAQLKETNQRLENMTENYQNLQNQLTLLAQTESQLLKELKS